MQQSNNSYKAQKNNDKKRQQEVNEKVAKSAAEGLGNVLAPGVGGHIADKALNTKLGQKYLKTAGKAFGKQNKGLSKIARGLDDNNMLDPALKALNQKAAPSAPSSQIEGANNIENGLDNNGDNPNPNNQNTSKSTNDLNKNKPTSNNNQLENNTDNLSSGDNESSSFKDKLSNFFNDDNKASSDTSQSGGLLGNLPFGGGSFFKSLKFKLIVAGIFLAFILLGGGIIAIIAAVDNSSSSASAATCETTSSPDQSSKQLARITTYTGSSLGGTLGDVSSYVREGSIYYEKGYAMWKGGTKSKANGKVYGKSGTDYIIVAMATEYLFGNCATKSCSYRWNRVPGVKYYKYGDTFTVGVKFSGQSKETEYNAIVLDSCGACMEWSLSASSSWLYSPHHTNSYELSQCKKSEGYKVDLFRRGSKVAGKADMGYVLNGVANNICVGEVDLGNLVAGVDDTKLLQGKSVLDVLGNSGVAALNNAIKTNVDKYGRGTGKGVAAAAITLINGLKEKGYRLPYYWAGGHSQVSDGVNPNWGNDSSTSCSKYGTCYRYSSLDCSGFVSWAIKNGGCSKFGPHSSGDFANLGSKISAKEAKAGDVLVHPGSHVVLVVQNNNGNLVLAESSGGTNGVHFTDYNTSNYKNNSSYFFVDMSKFYSSNSCK